jgi:GntR family transcriptional regulator
MPNVRVNSTSATPVYQQIVEQIRFMIEAGHLETGERLPSARLLAENLRVNRNTVAKAYATLRDMRLIATRGAAGTVVTAESVSVVEGNQRDQVRDLLSEPIRAAVELGLAPDEIGHIALNLALQAGSEQLVVVFVECNDERATAFAEELSKRLQVTVSPSLITELDEKAATCDVLVTTFFHLAEVRRWVKGLDRQIETAAVVVSPHIQTLMRIATLPKDAHVGVHYSTEHQAEQVRDWLTDAGSSNVSIIPVDADGIPADLDVLVVPAEHPELGEGAASTTQVIEFGGVLDEGSIGMLDEVLSEVRQRSIATGHTLR